MRSIEYNIIVSQLLLRPHSFIFCLFNNDLSSSLCFAFVFNAGLLIYPFNFVLAVKKAIYVFFGAIYSVLIIISHR